MTLAPGYSLGPTLDLGARVTARMVYLLAEPDALEWTHACANGLVTKDQIPLAPAWKSGWTLEALDPLTLAPSLLCRLCGFHGHIHAGRWVPA